MRPEKPPEPITEDEVKAFAVRLEEWGTQLPPKERALLHILLARTEGIEPSDARELVFGRPVGQAVASMLRLLTIGRGVDASAWVEAGDPWVQSGGGGWVEAGDPWVQSGGSRLDQIINVQSGASQLGRFLSHKARR